MGAVFMLWTILSIAVMFLLSFYTLKKARFAETRKVACVPLAIGLVDILTIGLLHPERYLILTFLLAAMRLVVIGCCVAALRRDTLRAKQKARRRISQRRKSIVELAIQPGAENGRLSSSPRCA